MESPKSGSCWDPFLCSLFSGPGRVAKGETLRCVAVWSPGEDHSLEQGEPLPESIPANPHAWPWRSLICSVSLLVTVEAHGVMLMHLQVRKPLIESGDSEGWTENSHSRRKKHPSRGVPRRSCWDSDGKAPIGGPADAQSSPLLLIHGSDLKKDHFFF